MGDEEDRVREREGLEMVLAGIRQGLAFMPDECASARAFGPLVPEIEGRLEVLEAQGMPAQRLRVGHARSRRRHA